MVDEIVKKLKTVLLEEFKPLHGEISRIITELRDFKVHIFKIDGEIRKSARETARLFSGMENIKDWLGEELGEINLKLDNLVDASEKAKKEIYKIKDHVGLTTTPS